MIGVILEMDYVITVDVVYMFVLTVHNFAATILF